MDRCAEDVWTAYASSAIDAHVSANLSLIAYISQCMLSDARQGEAIVDTTYIRTPADIGAVIRARRRAMGIDQAELARRIGASRLWVNQIERGKPGASMALVLRALTALDAMLMIRDAGLADAPADDLPTAGLDINSIIDGLRGKPGA